MKHAFLIIAHNEYPVLEVLLSMLDDERNDIYLHIDKRTGYRTVSANKKSQNAESRLLFNRKSHQSILG